MSSCLLTCFNHDLTIKISLYHVKNRSRPDIMATILESANGGITKTNLLTRANLTSGQLRQYLDVLITKKLVVQLADEERRHMAYRTTDKGMRYLSVYSILKSIAVFPREKD